MWGREVDTGIKGLENKGFEKIKNSKEAVDRILIELGVPIDLVEWSHAESDSYKFTPVDQDTRETLIDLEAVRDLAYRTEDYTKVNAITKDIKSLIEVNKYSLCNRSEMESCK